MLRLALLTEAMKAERDQDAREIRKDLASRAGPLTFDKAKARALKYNLEQRSEVMESLNFAADIHGKFPGLMAAMSGKVQIAASAGQ